MYLPAIFQIVQIQYIIQDISCSLELKLIMILNLYFTSLRQKSLEAKNCFILQVYLCTLIHSFSLMNYF